MNTVQQIHEIAMDSEGLEVVSGRSPLSLADGHGLKLPLKESAVYSITPDIDNSRMPYPF